ncbi:MAG TPA: hypothetical protein VF989_15845 [Polyangiaceae bacterium]|jgi:hypothetical protein
MNEIRPGDFVVIDQSGVNAGLMGSENTLAALKCGVRGFLSNGGVRDSDEVILQKVPFWSRLVSQSMVQSRLQFDATNVPVCVGGQTVCPGDVIVADGDGAIVVPRGVAPEVAEFAREERARDRKNRRRHYEDLGREPDGTVQPRTRARFKSSKANGRSTPRARVSCAATLSASVSSRKPHDGKDHRRRAGALHTVDRALARLGVNDVPEASAT